MSKKYPFQKIHVDVLNYFMSPKGMEIGKRPFKVWFEAIYTHYQSHQDEYEIVDGCLRFKENEDANRT